jgi:hypothetical protein
MTQKSGPIFLLDLEARVTYTSTTHRSRPKGIKPNQRNEARALLQAKTQQKYREKTNTSKKEIQEKTDRVQAVPDH